MESANICLLTSFNLYLPLPLTSDALFHLFLCLFRGYTNLRDWSSTFTESRDAHNHMLLRFKFSKIFFLKVCLFCTETIIILKCRLRSLKDWFLRGNNSLKLDFRKVKLLGKLNACLRCLVIFL